MNGDREDTSAMVETVHLDVGRFTCVEPDQLVTTYNAAVQGTWLDGSRLTITEIPFVGRCLICNGTYDPVPECAYRSPCCALEEIAGNCAPHRLHDQLVGCPVARRACHHQSAISASVWESKQLACTSSNPMRLAGIRAVIAGGRSAPIDFTST